MSTENSTDSRCFSCLIATVRDTNPKMSQIIIIIVTIILFPDLRIDYLNKSVTVVSLQNDIEKVF